MADHWKTGRDDMQSYDGLTGEPFTNIYHATETDGVHKPTGEPLPKVIGRAVGPDNKRVARMFAASPDMLSACELAATGTPETGLERYVLSKLKAAIAKAKGLTPDL